MHTCVHVCEDRCQHPAPSQSLSTLFCEIGSLGNLESTNSARLAGQHLCARVGRIFFFCRVLDNQTQVPRYTAKTFTN